MTDRWTDRLSEYLDDDLSAAERESLEAHLAGCPACAALLEELRAVMVRARSLDDRPPGRDLWQHIAPRIGATRTRPPRVLRFPRVVVSVPQLAAAAVTLMLASGGAVAWWTARAPATVAVRDTVPATAVAVLPAGAGFGGAGYDSVVAGLERALTEGRERLDSTTVRIIEHNLAIMDEAIAQARRALAADPASVYLNNHLAGTLKRKLDLLRRASQLTAVRS
jgi:anti-sigma factor RsiW